MDADRQRELLEAILAALRHTVGRAEHLPFLEPASLHLDQELTPALSALPDTNLEAHQFLRALGRVAPMMTSMHPPPRHRDAGRAPLSKHAQPASSSVH